MIDLLNFNKYENERRDKCGHFEMWCDFGRFYICQFLLTKPLGNNKNFLKTFQMAF